MRLHAVAAASVAIAFMLTGGAIASAKPNPPHPDPCTRPISGNTSCISEPWETPKPVQSAAPTSPEPKG